MKQRDRPKAPVKSAARASETRKEKTRIAALCRWFDRHRRSLPWRINRTGYNALVAEFMLQQTQVSRVVERYQAFLVRFPDVRSLAITDEQEVMSLWQGLGYYRRARLLHAAARMIVNKFEGDVPTDVGSLLELPGVGRYTAGAIASIVHGKPEPIVDGNVQRVFARWYGMRHASNDPKAVTWSWKKATRLVTLAQRPATFNEAMMELGALICTPASPKCQQCPVAKSCDANRLGLQNEIPRPKNRATPQVRHHHAVLITRNGHALVEQRSTSGMWAGLWQTPTVEGETALRSNALQKKLPVKVIQMKRCSSFDHKTSHRAIRFHVYRATSRARRGKWIDLNDLQQLPMSNAQRKVFALLQSPNADRNT